MRVTYGSTELADGVDTHVANLRVSGAQEVQVAVLIRADFGTPYARGNRVNTLSFDVAMESASQAAAMELQLTYGDDLPKSGELSFETSPTVVTGAAVLANIGVVRRGVRMIASYQFTVGEFIPITSGLSLDEVPDPDTVPDPDLILV